MASAIVFRLMVFNKYKDAQCRYYASFGVDELSRSKCNNIIINYFVNEFKEMDKTIMLA